MPSGGHNRVPAEIRRREGGSTVSHRPVPAPVRMGGRLDPANFPDPPDRLGDDGAEMWNELGPQLVEAGVLTRVHLAAFEDLCRHHMLKLSYGRVRVEEGPFVTSGRDGRVVQASWTRAERAESEQCRSLYSRFGLSPVDGSRLGLLNLAGLDMAATLERELGGSVAIEDINADGTVRNEYGDTFDVDNPAGISGGCPGL